MASVVQQKRKPEEALQAPYTEVQPEYGGDGPGSEESPRSLRSGQIGVWIFLATVTMLFAGFTSAYLVRRAGADWVPITAPRSLWLNSLVLLLSSATLEGARFARRREQLSSMKKWLMGTAVCGLLFLAGQIIAWRQLVAQGIFLPTNPHSSFFFMLTAVHALHLLGGIGAIGYLLLRAWSSRSSAQMIGTLNPYATYWHFMDALWLYVFLILFVI